MSSIKDVFTKRGFRRVGTSQPKKPGPLLAQKLRDREIELDGSAYVSRYTETGEPRDEDIHLGMVGEEDSIESYLAQHPTPDTWS